MVPIPTCENPFIAMSDTTSIHKFFIRLFFEFVVFFLKSFAIIQTLQKKVFKTNIISMNSKKTQLKRNKKGA